MEALRTERISAAACYGFAKWTESGIVFVKEITGAERDLENGEERGGKDTYYTILCSFCFLHMTRE